MHGNFTGREHEVDGRQVIDRTLDTGRQDAGAVPQHARKNPRKMRARDDTQAVILPGRIVARDLQYNGFHGNQGPGRDVRARLPEGLGEFSYKNGRIQENSRIQKVRCLGRAGFGNVDEPFVAHDPMSEGGVVHPLEPEEFGLVQISGALLMQPIDVSTHFFDKRCIDYAAKYDEPLRSVLIKLRRG